MTHVTINFKSGAVNMPVMLDVLLPENTKACKTLYLLHGMGGDRETWLLKSRIADYVDGKDIAVIMPSGNNKFFVNNVNGKAYQKFVAEELPAQMELWFSVSSKSEDRFVAGADMGGFGAVAAAVAYPGCFKAAVSFHNITYLKEMCRKLDERTVQTVFGSEKHCEKMLSELEQKLCEKVGAKDDIENMSETMYVLFDQPDNADWSYLDECMREIVDFITAGGNVSCQ